MAEISKLKLPDNNEYDLKVYTNHIAPMMTKTYTGVIGTANTYAAATFFFGTIKPTDNNYYTNWQIHYRLYAEAAGTDLSKASTDVIMTGSQNALNSYHAWNQIQNTSYRPAYYSELYRATQAGVQNGYGHALGIRLQSAWNPATAANARTIKIDIIECVNCTFTFFDQMTLYANIPGTGATNYVGYSEVDFTVNGLQEIGDNNDPNYQNREYYSTAFTTFAALYRYQILLSKSDTVLLPVNSVNNSTATTKELTTETFDPYGEVFYYNSTNTYNAGATIEANATLYRHINSMDFRYAFNFGGTLVANKPIYLVCEMQSDGMAKLHNPPIVQDPPTSEDGLVYKYLGHAVNTTNISLHLNKPLYWYKDGRFRNYQERVDNSYDVATQTSDGLLSKEDKTKLDGIAAGANKTTVDAALSTTSTNPVQNKVIKSELDSKLSTTDAESTYAKKVDITGVYKYKGSVASSAKLPTTNRVAGDVYNLEDTGMNVAWDGSKWDDLGGTFVTGVKGNAETAYRKGNVNLTAANIGAYDKAEYQSGAVTDVGMRPLVDRTRANRLALLPADQIIIEKTTDGGATWQDAGVSDAYKRGIFSSSMTAGSVNIPLLDGHKSTQCGIRFTITGMKYNVPDGTVETEKYKYWNTTYVQRSERYFNVREWYIWVSANNDRIRLQIERATGANSNNWSSIFNTDVGLSGWSGPNWVRAGNGSTFGGGSTQTGNYWNYRLTFWSRMVDNATAFASDTAQTIGYINCYGDSVWTMPNGLMGRDHLYTWDNDGNATFPGNLTAQKLNGHTLLSDVPANAKFTDTTYSLVTTSANGLMSSADKAKLDSIDTDAKVHEGDLVPVKSKTYTNVYVTANTDPTGWLYYLKIRPDNYNCLWKVKLRINSSINGVADGVQETIFEVNGMKSTFSNYYVYNSIANTSYRPVYAYPMYFVTQTGYNNGYSHLSGIRFQTSYDPITAAHARTITVDVLQESGCTTEFLDSMILYANAPGTGTTNYTSRSSFDGTTAGITITSDRNNYNQLMLSYENILVGANGIPAYSLAMRDSTGAWQGLTLGNSTTAATKTKNSIGFVPGDIIYLYSSVNQVAGNVTGNSTVYYYISSFDLRYSTNCASTLVADKPVFIVGTITNGLFYLDDTWWTQTLPTSKDGKVYVYLGVAYSTYQVGLNGWKAYYHDGTGIREYVVGDASTASSGLMSSSDKTKLNSIDVDNIVYQSVTGLSPTGSPTTEYYNKSQIDTKLATINASISSLSSQLSSLASRVTALETTVANHTTQITTIQNNMLHASN